MALQTYDSSPFQDAAEEVEQRLHVELVPGTEILADLTSTHFVHGRNKDVVLVPQPTAYLHDPLVRHHRSSPRCMLLTTTQNWSAFWKYATLVTCTIYMFLGNFTALSIAPLTPILIKEFDTTLSKVALLVSIPTLSPRILHSTYSSLRQELVSLHSATQISSSYPAPMSSAGDQSLWPVLSSSSAPISGKH
jgi:hypothetical protein